MSEERTHHPFSPSCLARREACPGSYRIESLCPPVEPGEAAKEGTRLHSLIADAIQAVPGLEVPEADSDIVVKCLSVLGREAAKLENSTAKVEQKLAYTMYGNTLLYGFADAVLVVPEGNAGTIIDWKTGRTEVEPADCNAQGAAYALCAMQMYGLDSVRVVFYNPVIGQDTAYTYTDEEALADWVAGIIERAEPQDAPCVPGEAQCRWCRGAQTGVCAAFQQRNMELAAIAEPLPPMYDMKDGDLAELKAKCECVKALQAAVDAELKKRCESNGTCAGWTLKERAGAKKITDVEAATARMTGEGMNMTREEIMPCVSLSVAALENAYAKRCKEQFGMAIAKGKAMFRECMGDLIEQGEPTRYLARIAE